MFSSVKPSPTWRNALRTPGNWGSEVNPFGNGFDVYHRQRAVNAVIVAWPASKSDPAVHFIRVPGKDPGVCIITVLLGVACALVAGWLGRAVGWYSENEGAGFIAAIVGAFILLLIYRLVAGRRA